jgi:hypothetical protein
MGWRNLSVLTLAAFVLALTPATNVAGGNGGVAPAGETGEKPTETGAPADTPAETPPDTAADTVTEAYDINALVGRLRDTKAIGFFTKLALKNQIDDLMDRFRRFHGREEETPLDTLRDQFNLLFMKVVTLLQDRDPALGREIAKGREILWGKLADPREFARL